MEGTLRTDSKAWMRPTGTRPREPNAGEPHEDQRHEIQMTPRHPTNAVEEASDRQGERRQAMPATPSSLSQRDWAERRGHARIARARWLYDAAEVIKAMIVVFKEALGSLRLTS